MNIEAYLREQALIWKWSPQAEASYRQFSNLLMQHSTLDIKIGKGGLSYYKPTPTGSVFVCHFNARPQSKRDDIGFADFRFDALRDRLDLDATLQALQAAASPDIQIKVNKLWCS